jgi:hypothetical protein
MENEQQTPNLFELQFDEGAKSNVLTMARWAMIIVLTSVVGYLLTIVKYFKQKSQLDAMMGDSEYDFQKSYASTAQTTGLVTIIISVLIGLLVTYFLYQFSAKAKSGMESMNSYDVNVGFANFKNYFLVIGILVILAMIFVGFAIVAALAMSRNGY